MHTVLGYLIADLGVRLLPPRMADRLGVWLARGVFALRPPARRAAERNLQRLAPDLAPRRRRLLARGAFEHFALTLVEFLRRGHRRASVPDAVEVRGRRHLARALAARRGVILLSAHLGNWERGAAFVAEAGIPLRVVARPHPHRWVERLFRERRREAGIETLDARPLWGPAATALRRGEWVALLGDRGGGSTSVCAWAAALARRTGALVLPAVMVRVAPRRYAACFGAPLSPAACARGAYGAAMRRFLRRYPSQWCAFEPLPSGWS